MTTAPNAKPLYSSKPFAGDRLFDEVAPSLFRLKVEHSGPTRFATAFTVATLKAGTKLVLATAEHVLNVPDEEEIWWTVEQYDAKAKLIRSVRFGSHKKRFGDTPYRRHLKHDVGFLILPRLRDDGKPFALPDERPLKTIAYHAGCTTGTRVGWAGYSVEVEEALRFPHPCYFEGVVSAMVNSAELQTYIIDGHNTHGVSGGPVWHASADSDELQIIGVVSAYHPGSQPRLPGFVRVEPINAVTEFLLYWRQQDPDADLQFTMA